MSNTAMRWPQLFPVSISLTHKHVHMPKKWSNMSKAISSPVSLRIPCRTSEVLQSEIQLRGIWHPAFSQCLTQVKPEMTQIAQDWKRAMRLPKSWAQPSKIRVDCKRKTEELLKLSSWFSPPQTQACIMATPLPPWEFSALHREFQPKHQSLKALTMVFQRMCFLHDSSSLFDHLRVSVQFTLWCCQIYPKDSWAHLPSQLLFLPLLSKQLAGESTVLS